MNQPIPGIFYVLTNDFKTGNILLKISKANTLKVDANAYQAGYHVDFWEEIAQQYGYGDLEHEYFPRGRINVFDDYVEVISDRCLTRSKWFKSEIKKLYPDSKIKYFSDRKAHYSCFGCKSR